MKKVMVLLVACAVVLMGAQVALAETTYVELGAGTPHAYYGQMVDGEMSGFGIYHDPSGVIYYGEQEGSDISGVGVIVYPEDEPNGALHRSGVFLRGKANGENAILIKDQTRYMSNYTLGEPVPGSREVTNMMYEWRVDIPMPDSSRYTGEMYAGGNLANGYGVRFYADGGIYAGSFVNDERDGRGIYMDAHKNSVAGIWERGLVVQSTRVLYADPEYPLDWIFRNDRPQTAGQYSTMEQLVDGVIDSVYYVGIYDKDNRKVGSGSGFVAFNEELFVTNHHVIEGAAYLETISDSEKVFVLDELLYADEANDVAILRFPKEANVRALQCNSQEEVKRGQEVIAIGSPEGIKNTVSNGIISGYGRSTSVAETPSLQFTASISHGSSGGALFNMRGEVIGVVYCMNEGGQNLNFAIPIAVVEQLQTPENYHPKSLRDYNELGGSVPEIENLCAVVKEGAIELMWASMEGAVEYAVFATNPQSPEEPELLTRFAPQSGAAQVVLHSESALYPEFIYQYVVLALDASEHIIGASGGVASVLDL